MTTEGFLKELDQRIAKYDLLCHPFYRARSAGELKPTDLAEYGRDYYHHVAAFPFYLEQLGHRLTDEKMRLAVGRTCWMSLAGGAHAYSQTAPMLTSGWTLSKVAAELES